MEGIAKTSNVPQLVGKSRVVTNRPQVADELKGSLPSIEEIKAGLEEAVV